MEPFLKISSPVIPLLRDNIDTDQIIPAQYLKVTDKEGLSQGCFSSWRYKKDGSLDPDFPINKPEYKDAKILLAGDNFGCGSSREHAPWALYGIGIRAIISTSFADIFRSNAMKNGILPVTIDPKVHSNLVVYLKEQPMDEATIDLETQTLLLPNGTKVTYPIDPFNKLCLQEGIDQMDYLLKQAHHIAAYENERGLAKESI